MSSASDRDNDAAGQAAGPLSGASAGAEEAGSCDPSGIVDIRFGVRKAHGFALTDDNIVRAVESTIEIADGVLLVAARAADVDQQGPSRGHPAAAESRAIDLWRDPVDSAPEPMAGFLPDEALQTGARSPQRSLAQWGFAVSVSALVAVLIAGNPLSGVKLTASEPAPPAPAGTAAPPPAPAAAASTIVEPAAPAEEPRLLVQTAERGSSDQTLPLGMTIDHRDGAAGLLIDGLPDGASLTAGRPSGPDQWYVPAADLADAAVRPPHGFAGAMDLSVELQLAEGRVAERRSVRLEWAPPPEQNPVPVAAAPAGPPALAGLTLRKLDTDEITTLRKRGEEFFANGDVAAARLMLQRAAEAGDARAALALAATYDPIALGDIGIRGSFADATMARTWYERAKAFGSPDAPHRLELLASREH